MSEEQEQKLTLFQKLYKSADAAIKLMKAPLTEKSMKRSFQAAYDDAERIMDESEISLMEERQKFNKVEVNKILTLKKTIRQAQVQRRDIEDEYKELFNSELK